MFRFVCPKLGEKAALESFLAIQFLLRSLIGTQIASPHRPIHLRHAG
jgi:hypothetical protein